MTLSKDIDQFRRKAQKGFQRGLDGLSADIQEALKDATPEDANNLRNSWQSDPAQGAENRRRIIHKDPEILSAEYGSENRPAMGMVRGALDHFSQRKGRRG